ncbi:dephospho-CoA kinase [Flavobacterium silvaticum]|uniref:Dephospho-CoA kinase n=1 Tax=Flavobacterium silvaticum TaxID=1852020 RepID=A0A972G280_9FLAO|nr:dephospho-CoA kinase [Flavobacterium silvaticum]NMH29121.1 dephospho-CoA kinase [Flavobacterium silvaticum]
MTKIIGLTGGIGSGKSTVALYFEENDIPVYYADEKAKEVTRRPDILSRIEHSFGASVISGTSLDRKKLAAIVFNSPEKLEQLNGIIHPAVRQDFAKWLSQHEQYPIVVREAAILFESGSYKDCDAIITVTASVESKIQRVMKRDSITRESVLARMKNQWDDDRKAALSDYVILNEDLEKTRTQFDEILKSLKNL